AIPVAAIERGDRLRSPVTTCLSVALSDDASGSRSRRAAGERRECRKRRPAGEPLLDQRERLVAFRPGEREPRGAHALAPSPDFLLYELDELDELRHGVH